LDHAACSGKNDRQGLVQVSAMFVLLLLTRERAGQLHQPQPMLKAFAWFGSFGNAMAVLTGSCARILFASL
jgi:hypothetical protein